MPQGCDVAPASSNTPQKQFLLPKTTLRVSIVEHFAALKKAIENLAAIEEELNKGAAAEDLFFFQQYAELYRQSLPSQWLALQKQLGWLKVEDDENDRRSQETAVSATHRDDSPPLSPAPTSGSSLDHWVDCPPAFREQMAGCYQVLEAQRREMDQLQKRIADLEEIYEDDDNVCL